MELQNNIAAQHMVDQNETERQPGLTDRGMNVLVLLLTVNHIRGSNNAHKHFIKICCRITFFPCRDIYAPATNLYSHTIELLRALPTCSGTLLHTLYCNFFHDGLLA